MSLRHLTLDADSHPLLRFRELCMVLSWLSSSRSLGCNSWVRQFKADAQKERSEKQSAVQVAGKRTHIDFSRSKEKEVLQPKKSRFQPYGTAGAPVAKERQKTRWG